MESITVCEQGRIINVQCARAHEAPQHQRAHHQAVVKIVMRKFVTEVWLKCIKMMTKTGHQFLRSKKCGGPTKTVHTLPR